MQIDRRDRKRATFRSVLDSHVHVTCCGLGPRCASFGHHFEQTAPLFQATRAPKCDSACITLVSSMQASSGVRLAWLLPSTLIQITLLQCCATLAQESAYELLDKKQTGSRTPFAAVLGLTTVLASALPSASIQSHTKQQLFCAQFRTLPEPWSAGRPCNRSWAPIWPTSSSPSIDQRLMLYISRSPTPAPAGGKCPDCCIPPSSSQVSPE